MARVPRPAPPSVISAVAREAASRRKPAATGKATSIEKPGRRKFWFGSEAEPSVLVVSPSGGPRGLVPPIACVVQLLVRNATVTTPLEASAPVSA